MKILQTVIEEEKEGFLALMGQTITVYCMNYIYTGKLVGVNSDQIKLENAKIVYETGSFNSKEWKTTEAFPNDIYLRHSAIEMYTILK